MITKEEKHKNAYNNAILVRFAICKKTEKFCLDGAKLYDCCKTIIRTYGSIVWWKETETQHMGFSKFFILKTKFNDLIKFCDCITNFPMQLTIKRLENKNIFIDKTSTNC